MKKLFCLLVTLTLTLACNIEFTSDGWGAGPQTATHIVYVAEATAMSAEKNATDTALIHAAETKAADMTSLTTATATVKPVVHCDTWPIAKGEQFEIGWTNAVITVTLPEIADSILSGKTVNALLTEGKYSVSLEGATLTACETAEATLGQIDPDLICELVNLTIPGFVKKED